MLVAERLQSMWTQAIAAGPTGQPILDGLAFEFNTQTPAVLVESVVFTEEKMQAMGIPAGTLPIGWWIGFKVTDEDVWEKVKDGTYPMFSIEGEAERIEVEDENTL